MSLQAKAHLLNHVECILWPSLCMLVGFNEGFSGAVSQWQSPRNYRLLGLLLCEMKPLLERKKNQVVILEKLSYSANSR